MDNITIRCVGWLDHDQGRWQAVALDLDLFAEGESAQAAIDALHELINIQISFAAARNDLESIWRHAPQEYWEMYERARRHHATALYGHSQAEPAEESVADLPFPDAHVIKQIQADFA